MELLEYQAKELFKMVGIPILPSQTIQDSRKIKQLQIPYPVVLKSQVRAGGRGKAGGIKFVANTIDAIAAARTIFNLSILGEYPEVILAEAHYNTEREFFLAIVLDYELQCPVLLGSASGGMNVNSLLANLQQVVIAENFSLFHARRLAASMGLSGKLICSVSQIIAKMYCLFREQDLDSIEINPLGVNARGELMALDGKIAVNNSALGRQPVVSNLDLVKERRQNPLNRTNWYWLKWRNQTGKIATICNSFDLSLLSWDLFGHNRINPACGIVIESSSGDLEEDLPFDRDSLWNALTALETVSGLNVIFINIWETEAASEEIVRTIADYLRSKVESDSTLELPNLDVNGDLLLESPSRPAPKTTVKSKPKFVLRLLPGEDFASLELPETMYLYSSLSRAIDRTTSLVKSS